MNVHSLLMRGFMNHHLTELTLPATGIVVVTGSNGAGKSSMLEAVAVAGWGETLRGTTPWPRDKDGEVLVRLATKVADTFDMRRIRRSGKVALEFRREGKTASEQFETATKAQAALETHIGSYDLWRRTHVFSSSDAAHFTQATDAERKRLVEGVLGNERFDPALQRCRTDLRVNTTTHDSALLQIEQLRQRVLVEQQRLKDAESLLATTPELTSDAKAAADRERLRDMAGAAQQEVRSLHTKRMNLNTTSLQLKAQQQEAQRRLSLLGAGNCPTCTQPIPAAMVETLRGSVDRYGEMVGKAQAAEREKSVELEALYSELSEEAGALQAKLSHLEGRLFMEAKQGQQRAQAANVLKAAQAAVAGVTEEGKRLKDELAALSVKVKVLTAVESVLGLKGVRSRLMAKALTGIEVATNRWLMRMAGGNLKLRLKPYTEKKSGGTSESISMEIEGAGDGNGYRAASQGERRRLDIAVMLGLADMSAAAFGTKPAVLWFDEALDGLDPEGEEAAVLVLNELAQERAVVVITHRPSLAEGLPARVRWHVEDGRVV